MLQVIIKNGIETFPYDRKYQLLFPFDACMLGVSKMVRASNTATMPGTYYIPQIAKEVKVFSSFSSKFDIAIEGWQEIRNKNIYFILSTQSSAHLYEIQSNTVDFIFTDPPYAEKVQYGELNFIWEAWLNFDTHWHEDEIIINETRGKTEGDWKDLMESAMGECYRVLKPGRSISLCYHDTSEGTWTLVQDIMAKSGFLTEKSNSALYIDAGQKSYNQTVADKVNKRDLVINFRKPKPGEVAASVSLTGQEDAATFAEKVRHIIRDYLEAHPGSTKDRVYDEVVSRMVRSGQMEAHSFEALLRQAADEVVLEGEKGSSRWYLKEAELTAADAAETAREDNAAAKLEAFAQKYLLEHLAAAGVHYSDLFEHYIYAVKDKPRRQLADILPDYFYKTDDGTWRLPASDAERAAKAKARAAGLGRRVKRYIALLEAGAAIPEHERQSDATLAEWLRYCKRAGLFAQGRLLYEKGGLNTDNLPEEAMVGVEEDYQACVLMLKAGRLFAVQRTGRADPCGKNQRGSGGKAGSGSVLRI
jgi:16S rRNA G966 N2-methylase RsmD